jgi:hypothetical protein
LKRARPTGRFIEALLMRRTRVFGFDTDAKILFQLTSKGGKMISGVHNLLYSRDAGATRAFLRDVLKLGSVDAGDGWLIFALPPAELGVHPTDAKPFSEMYLLCDDVQATVAELRAKGVDVVGEIRDEGWGLVTSIQVPGAGAIGLYQPRHPTAI